MHRTLADFWKDYEALPADIRDRADKQFALLRENPRHPSLHFKKLTERNGQEIWSARVTLKYRALAPKVGTDYVRSWIGEHETYETLLR
jgi:mRNA-degrading endonuclease RelE of RelBE toxin-antitoxin system